MNKVLCVLTTLALTACGSGASAYNSASSNSHVANPLPSGSVHFVPPGAPIFRGRLTLARHYPDLQIDLLPPSANATALKTANDAYGTCWIGAPCVANVSPEIVLALWTDGSFSSRGANGSVFHPYQNVLVYAMTWHNSQCLAHGIPGGKPAFFACDHAVFVDANTDQPLLAIDAAPYTES